MNNNTTHTQQLKADFASNKKQILWLTKMSEEQYLNFRSDMAKAFVEANYRQEQWGFVIASIAFCKWWIYNWNSIDDKWILEELYHINEPSRCSMYRMMHQYVFDNDDENQELLMKDFLSVRSSFLPSPIIYSPEGEE